jgi:hypothetical protein
MMHIPMWHAPALSSNVAAKLQVIDVNLCERLNSINAVRSCGQLRCLLMFGAGVSPLAACSQLEDG